MYFLKTNVWKRQKIWAAVLHSTGPSPEIGILCVGPHIRILSAMALPLQNNFTEKNGVSRDDVIFPISGKNVNFEFLVRTGSF